MSVARRIHSSKASAWLRLTLLAGTWAVIYLPLARAHDCLDDLTRAED
jgi:hypothetical protein